MIFKSHFVRNITRLLPLLFIGLFITTILTHWAVSTIKGYQFYLSESMLYSSYWLIALLTCSKFNPRKKSTIAFLLNIFIIHLIVLFATSIIIWLIGETIIYHPYRFNNIIGYHIESMGIPGYVIFLLVMFLKSQKQLPNPQEDWVHLGNQKFKPSYITHIIADGHYLFIHGRDGRRHHVRCSIKKAITLLEESEFKKIGRSVIIHPSDIQTFIREKNHQYLVTSLGSKIKIPKDYK